MMEVVARALQWQEYGPYTVPPKVRANMALVEPRRQALEDAGVVPFGEQPVSLRGSGIAGVLNTASGPRYMKNMEPGSPGRSASRPRPPHRSICPISSSLAPALEVRDCSAEQTWGMHLPTVHYPPTGQSRI